MTRTSEKNIDCRTQLLLGMCEHAQHALFDVQKNIYRLEMTSERNPENKVFLYNTVKIKSFNPFTNFTIVACKTLGII